MILVECGLQLSGRSTTFLLLTSAVRFSQNIFMHRLQLLHQFASIVQQRFKNSKGTINVVIPLYTQQSFSSLNFSVWSRLWIRPCQYTVFCVDLFFVTSNKFLKKRVIFLPWKKNCLNRYAILLILLTKKIRKPNAKLEIAFASGGRLWIKMCLGQVLIFKYFGVD